MAFGSEQQPVDLIDERVDDGKIGAPDTAGGYGDSLRRDFLGPGIGGRRNDGAWRQRGAVIQAAGNWDLRPERVELISMGRLGPWLRSCVEANL